MSLGLILTVFGFLALGLGGLLAYRAFSRQPPVAGGRGPARFSRDSFEPKEKKARGQNKPALNFRVLALWLAILVILAWVGFSLAIRPDSASQIPALSAQESAPASASPRLTPTLSGSLIGPPPEGPIPPEPNAPPKPAPAPAPVANPAPNQAPGLFTPKPEERDRPSPMVTAAQSMAPVISRMEPVGRTLSSSPPAKAAAKSPAPEKARPRISAPPIARPPAPPVADDPNLGLEPPKAQKYTVLLGAFGKQENAINLKNRLEAAGLPVAISEFTDKNKLWYRVMSGSFEDKDSAEAYSRELRQRKLVDRPYVRPM